MLTGVGALATLAVPHSIAGVLACTSALGVLLRHRSGVSPVTAIPPAVLLGSAFLANRLWNLVAGVSLDTSERDDLTSLIYANWRLFWPDGLSPGMFISTREGHFVALLGFMCVGVVGYRLQQENVPQRALAMGLLVTARLTSINFARPLAFPIPPRYGASLIPLALLLFANPRSRWIYRGVLLCSAAAAVTVVWRTGHLIVQVPAS